MKKYLLLILTITLSSCFKEYRYREVEPVVIEPVVIEPEIVHITSDKDAYSFNVKKGQTLVFIDELGNQIVIRK